MTTTIQSVHFWKWFSRNNSRYLQLCDLDTPETEYWLHELQLHLSCVNPHLTYEITVLSEHGFSLIITPDRNADLFSTARKLVASAPSLPHWSIGALRPPREIDFDFETRFGNSGIDPGKLRFKPYPEVPGGSKLESIAVYIPGYRSKHDDEYYPAVKAILENLVGEEILATVLGLVAISALDKWALELEDIFPIQQLPVYVGRMKSPYKVNKEGKIDRDKV